jgi:hypothetical protein
MATPTQITNAQRYAEAMKQAEELRQAATGEIFERITRDIAELNSFGHTYRLTQDELPVRRGPYRKANYCATCGIEGHDGRTHRHQTIKRKFTATELKSLGLERG